MEKISCNEFEWLCYIRDNTPRHEELVDTFSPTTAKPFMHLRNIGYVTYGETGGNTSKYQITELGNAYIEYKEAVDKDEKFHRKMAWLSLGVAVLAVLISLAAMVFNRTVYIMLPPC
ncbi:MAG: hypothetical protein FWE04_01735 [Oscillospiraceae bacterium]|nr:hypothetical protein [Oscillospiraceae bacterium]